jgi:hypothetical protein
MILKSSAGSSVSQNRVESKISNPAYGGRAAEEGGILTPAL